MGRADEERLRELAATVAEAAGYDVEELVVVAAGRRRLVRIIIDGDNGVSLDAAADVSRGLAAALDALDETDENPMGPAPYTLEVTSPGIGRPLTEERHFRRARGRLLDLTLTDGTSVTGRVRRILPRGSAEAGLELLIDWDCRVIPLAEISRAKVEVEFGKMPLSHQVILDADGFVDPARAVDLDEVGAADDNDSAAESDESDFEEFDSVDDFEKVDRGEKSDSELVQIDSEQSEGQNR